ncbi:MAG TPA: hypothetical protein VMS40_04755 [Vicinamibacterales bacterium]|jgi:hypothetical protein|nr:hypothetical protein [Vicinamibacterales bacterium]
MQHNFFCYRTLGLAALVTLLQACGDPKSSSTSGSEGGPVPTSRMTINLRVVSSESGIAVVRANLNDGRAAGDSYRLDGGDFFRACVSGLCRNMADNDSLTSPDYIARFDYQSGVDYVVAFNRQEAQNAPDSRVTLPPAFTIVTPANHQQVTDGETVLVSWSPTGAPARVSMSYDADCTFLSGSRGFSSGTLNEDSSADGRESVRIDPIVEVVRSSSPSTITRCSIVVTVSHELQGRIDPAFRNGTAVGIVSREVDLDYIPR